MFVMYAFEYLETRTLDISELNCLDFLTISKFISVDFETNGKTVECARIPLGNP